MVAFGGLQRQDGVVSDGIWSFLVLFFFYITIPRYHHRTCITTTCTRPKSATTSTEYEHKHYITVRTLCFKRLPHGVAARRLAKLREGGKPPRAKIRRSVAQPKRATVVYGLSRSCRRVGVQSVEKTKKNNRHRHRPLPPRPEEISARASAAAAAARSAVDPGPVTSPGRRGPDASSTRTCGGTDGITRA